MRTLALLVFLAVGVLTIPSSPEAGLFHDWSKRFGDAEDQSGSSIAVDGWGNILATGAFRGTVDFGGGPLISEGLTDIFVVKFDPDGNHLWSQRFGDVDYQGLSPTEVSADGEGDVIVTGGFTGTMDFGGGPLTSVGGGDIFVAKFDADGAHLWSKQFGDAGMQNGLSVAADGSGNVIVTGHFFGTVDFGSGSFTSAGNDDVFVVKFDANGNHLWSQRFGDGGSQFGQSVAADGSGNVVVTGDFFGTVDFGGGPLTSAGRADVFIAKFDANGNHLWSERFGDATGRGGNHWGEVTVDESGSVVLVGFLNGTADFGGGPLTSAGSSDISVAKFAPNGDHLWSKRFGDANYQVGNSVAVDGSGDVIVTGVFHGTVDFGGGTLTSRYGDIYVAKLDVNGGHLWSQRFGDDSSQGGNSVSADASGNVLVTGTFYGTVDFGGGPMTASNSDVFIVKFGEAPLPVRVTRFEATPRRGVVEVTWDVWSDESLESFTLYRRDDATSQAIVIAEGPFNTTTRSHIDTSVEPGATYQYELLIHTHDGDEIRSSVATVTVPALKATLGQNFPNPFKPTTTIEYTLSEHASAVLGIYDAAGRLIARLDQGVREAGTHQVEWNGRDADGRAVGSGVYFYKLEGVRSIGAKKMVLVR